MFESPESANLWFDIFNGVLLTGAFFVAVGTWGTIKTAAIKERFSDERISSNELETKRAIAESDSAKEGTAKANEAIAAANERAAALENDAAQARAEQERLKQVVSWRILSPEALRRFTSKLQQGGSATIAYAANDPEALYLWTQITKAFPQPAWSLRSQARTYEGKLLAGIFIFGPDSPSLRAIKEAFTAAGLAFGTDNPGNPHMHFGDPLDPNVATVLIASKMPPI